MGYLRGVGRCLEVSRGCQHSLSGELPMVAIRKHHSRSWSELLASCLWFLAVHKVPPCTQQWHPWQGQQLLVNVCGFVFFLLFFFKKADWRSQCENSHVKFPRCLGVQLLLLGTHHNHQLFLRQYRPLGPLVNLPLYVKKSIFSLRGLEHPSTCFTLLAGKNGFLSLLESQLGDRTVLGCWGLGEGGREEILCSGTWANHQNASEEQSSYKWQYLDSRLIFWMNWLLLRRSCEHACV